MWEQSVSQRLRLWESVERSCQYFIFLRSGHINKNVATPDAAKTKKQAGAELCQAQVQLDLVSIGIAK